MKPGCTKLNLASVLRLYENIIFVAVRMLLAERYSIHATGEREVRHTHVDAAMEMWILRSQYGNMETNAKITIWRRQDLQGVSSSSHTATALKHSNLNRPAAGLKCPCCPQTTEAGAYDYDRHLGCRLCITRMSSVGLTSAKEEQATPGSCRKLSTFTIKTTLRSLCKAPAPADKEAGG